jgi:hypothetical protein
VAYHLKVQGILFLGGIQFWSNPDGFFTDRAIAIILRRPTLIDLIFLKRKYGAQRLIDANEKLWRDGAIHRYDYIVDILPSLKEGDSYGFTR